MQAYVKLQDNTGKFRRARVALDTQSNVSYVHSDYAAHRQWDADENPRVRGLEGVVNPKPAKFTIEHPAGPIQLKGRVAPPGMFPHYSCGQRTWAADDPVVALLGLPHIAALRIDLNAHMAINGHVNMIYTNPP